MLLIYLHSPTADRLQLSLLGAEGGIVLWLTNSQSFDISQGLDLVKTRQFVHSRSSLKSGAAGINGEVRRITLVNLKALSEGADAGRGWSAMLRTSVVDL